MLGAIVLLAVVAGCSKGGPLESIPVQTPVDTANAYFQAFNNLDLELLQAHLSDGKQANPGFGGDWGLWYDTVPPRDFFGDVTCATALQTATSAQLECSFTAKADWEGFARGAQRWCLDMSRVPRGPWLIDDWSRD